MYGVVSCNAKNVSKYFTDVRMFFLHIHGLWKGYCPVGQCLVFFGMEVDEVWAWSRGHGAQGMVERKWVEWYKGRKVKR